MATPPQVGSYFRNRRGVGLGFCRWLLDFCKVRSTMYNTSEGCDIATFVALVGVGAISNRPGWTTIHQNRVPLQIAARKGGLRAFWRFPALTDVTRHSLRPLTPKGTNRRAKSRIFCGAVEFLRCFLHVCKSPVLNNGENCALSGEKDAKSVTFQLLQRPG